MSMPSYVANGASYPYGNFQGGWGGNLGQYANAPNAQYPPCQDPPYPAQYPTCQDPPYPSQYPACQDPSYPSQYGGYTYSMPTSNMWSSAYGQSSFQPAAPPSYYNQMSPSTYFPPTPTPAKPPVLRATTATYFYSPHYPTMYNPPTPPAGMSRPPVPQSAAPAYPQQWQGDQSTGTRARCNSLPMGTGVVKKLDFDGANASAQSAFHPLYASNTPNPAGPPACTPMTARPAGHAACNGPQGPGSPAAGGNGGYVTQRRFSAPSTVRPTHPQCEPQQAPPAPQSPCAPAAPMRNLTVPRDEAGVNRFSQLEGENAQLKFELARLRLDVDTLQTQVRTTQGSVRGAPMRTEVRRRVLPEPNPMETLEKAADLLRSHSHRQDQPDPQSYAGAAQLRPVMQSDRPAEPDMVFQNISAMANRYTSPRRPDLHTPRAVRPQHSLLTQID